MNIQGLARLFLPNLLQTPIPLNLPNHTTFPFPDPPQDNDRRLPRQVTCKPLRRAAISTRNKSRTQLTLKVINMDQATRLHTLRRSSRLWDNLCTYADPAIQNPVPTNVPTGKEQMRATFALWGWFSMHHHDTDHAVVEGEEAICDEVFKQLIHPINLMLRARYANLIQERIGSWPDHNDNNILPRPEVYYPLWSHSTRGVHKTSSDPNAAGFPDFLLHAVPLKATSRNNIVTAVAEIKTFWSYQYDSFALFNDETARSGSGTFIWNHTHIGTTVIKQIWSELHFFTGIAGFWTNGQIIFVFLKTGDNELTVSTPQSWTQENVLRTLFGLSCVLVDINRNPQNRANIINRLTPDKESNW